MTSSTHLSRGWLRKRPLSPAEGSVKKLEQEQDQSFHQPKNGHKPCSPSTTPRSERVHSPKPPPFSLDSDGYYDRGTPSHAHGSNCPNFGKQPNWRVKCRILFAKIQEWNDHARRKSARYEFVFVKVIQCQFQVQTWHDRARQRSPRYECLFDKTKHYLHLCVQLLQAILLRLIRTTCKQKVLFLFIVAFYYSSYVYFVKLPVWRYEEEWTCWEKAMQQSVADSIPPLRNFTEANIRFYSNSEHLEQFPYLRQWSASWDGIGPSEFVVPVPDYELIGRMRGKLARALRGHAVESCEKHKRDRQGSDQTYLLPVMGITVANDTPENRYLRRLLLTVDLNVVGSIVVTWYDEQTEAQIAGKERTGLSHDVVEQALREFVARRGFDEISRDGEFADVETAPDGPFSHRTRLADATALELMSRTATSIRQFCLFGDGRRKDGKRNKFTDGTSSGRRICRNELLILRFSTNLGCSAGVNNPLFTHPTAPHWLIANYDIAYPLGVLRAMGRELQNTRLEKPDLAVHTYGYIYGRGRLENPWSNFVMTSCAVANAGVWDENIFPAYYEDDDYRDRIRYIMGRWKDVIGDEERHGNTPLYFMDDKHLIHYQTGRHISVAHGPLNANTYLSGTAESMRKVDDDETEDGILASLWLRMWGKPQHPFHYENQRWNVVRTVSDTKGFFLCKHGALPEPGEHGEDSVRYFGRDERFLLPFVNGTRASGTRESMPRPDRADSEATPGGRGGTGDPAPWADWHFNATRRKCVHEAANLILSMRPSEERTNLMQEFRALCSVC